jgi:zinc and cadmium transporter
MADIWVYTLISVIVVSAVSLIAVFFLSVNEATIKKLLLFLVSFAVGGLFGDALIHLLPESFEKLDSRLVSSFLVLAGILIFFILEKFIHWRHCHDIDCEEHTHPVVTVNIIGDATHNLIDGMLVAASYSVSIPLGFTTTIAVILHEIPHEIGNFGVLVHGGLPVKKALLYNFLSALAAILGAIITLVIGPQVKGFAEVLLPITAGGFIYVAGSDLIPELKHEVHISHSILQLIAIIFGIILMSLLTLMGS